MDEDVGVPATGEFASEFRRVCRVRDDDTVRLSGKALRRFFRGNQCRDIAPGLAKKIRASFTGVTTAGEEDARS